MGEVQTISTYRVTGTLASPDPFRGGVVVDFLDMICTIPVNSVNSVHPTTFPFPACFFSAVFFTKRSLRILQLQYPSYCICVRLPLLFLTLQFFFALLCDLVEAALSG